MDTQYIISKSLQNYDSVSNTIRFLKNSKINKLVPVQRVDGRDFWTFYNIHTNETVLETEVEYLGSYNTKLKVWCWAWSVPTLRNIDVELSKKMLLYALELGPEFSYLKSILITSRGTIIDPIQLDIHIALASYILKQPYIYSYIKNMDDYNLIHYYILLNTEAVKNIKSNSLI